MANDSLHLELTGLGTLWQIKLWGEKGDSAKISDMIRTTMSEFEEGYSRFKKDSLVDRLNKMGVVRNPPTEMVKMVDFAHKMYEFTDGAFDICLGAELENIGYDAEYSFKAKESKQIGIENDSNQTPVLKSQATQQELAPFPLSYSKAEIRISPDKKLDFGGMGKGWLIDKLAAKIRQHYKPTDLLINAGGDILVFSKSGRQFTAALENPFDTSQAIGTIKFTNSAIACSASNRRRWQDPASGKTFHHLIIKTKSQPQSQSADHFPEKAAVFTQAPTALLADTAATAIFVSPDSEHLPKFANNKNTQGFIVLCNHRFLKSEKYSGNLY